jgi:hypothetical protein
VGAYATRVLPEEKPRLPKKTGPELDRVRPLTSPVSPSAPNPARCIWFRASRPWWASSSAAVVRDTQHLKDLALDQFTNRPGVTRIETSIIFEARRRYELPVFQMED